MKKIVILMRHLRDGEIKCKNQIKNSIAFVKANGWDRHIQTTKVFA